LATAKGTVISIITMACTKRDKSVKESIKAVARGIRRNF